MFKTNKRIINHIIAVILLMVSLSACAQKGKVIAGDKTMNIGSIGNKITVDGTVAYVAGENAILVPYDFSGDFTACSNVAYSKSLKGCENPRLPSNETDDLPEEVSREIISFYGDIGGFWTSLAADHTSIEIVGQEPKSVHYAGVMKNYFSVGNDGVADTVYGYCLDGTDDTTTMGLLVYHVKYFRMLADKLAGYTEKCTISFIDLYRNTQRNISPLNIQIPTEIQIEQLVTQFSEIAAQYGIYIDTCAEKIDLDKFGIKHAHCIDKDRLERIGQYTLDIDKDKNQRTECGCFASIDIGTYNTCKNGCLYCYANFSQKAVCNNFGLHDPTSPLLFGTIGGDDVIKEREVHSCRNCQMNLF